VTLVGCSRFGPGFEMFPPLAERVPLPLRGSLPDARFGNIPPPSLGGPPAFGGGVRCEVGASRGNGRVAWESALRADVLPESVRGARTSPREVPRDLRGGWR